MYSAYKAAFDKLKKSDDGQASSEKTWQEAFHLAIQKLTLAEAASDTQEKGMELVCREKERQQITSFLKKAICGLVQSSQNEDGEGGGASKHLKSSLFIAGPPGTGKVSSSCSISMLDHHSPYKCALFFCVF